MAYMKYLIFVSTNRKKMENLTIKSTNGNETFEISVKQLADDLQNNLSGAPASTKMLEFTTQEIVDKFDVRVRTASGDCMGFKYDVDAVLDAYDVFRKL